MLREGGKGSHQNPGSWSRFGSMGDAVFSMKKNLVELLICPACLPEESGLIGNILEKDGEDIFTGSLRCPRCDALYPIEEGIAVLLPGSPLDHHEPSSKYERPSVVSTYLWSHFGDILGDEDAGTAYREWAELLREGTGISLDAGCAVGRFTLELSRKSDFALGMDNSRSFVRAARELVRMGQLTVDLPQEGLIHERKKILLPDAYDPEKIEFLMGDAQRLPFRSRLFTFLASLNLVDKIPRPLAHLKEMNRVAGERGVQFLISDPFSWSLEVAREEDWLGGTRKGAFSGRGIDNILSLMSGKAEGLTPPWSIDRQGQIWWKIRNHQNHFELIRSRFIKASR